MIDFSFFFSRELFQARLGLAWRLQNQKTKDHIALHTCFFYLFFTGLMSFGQQVHHQALSFPGDIRDHAVELHMLHLLAG